ncbi:MAG: hypothetical protein ACFB15_24690 [Cyclobacteriaceae bacterium]
MPRPRGHDWLEDEIIKLKKDEVQTIVSLLEQGETLQLGIEDEGAICDKYEVGFISLPIPDREIPTEQWAVNQLIYGLVKEINEGKTVVIHCRMGIGRSTIIAGAVLLQFGMSAEQILSRISEVRKIQVPDTNEQVQWLHQQERLKRNAE